MYVYIYIYIDEFYSDWWKLIKFSTQIGIHANGLLLPHLNISISF